MHADHVDPLKTITVASCTTSRLDQSSLFSRQSRFRRGTATLFAARKFSLLQASKLFRTKPPCPSNGLIHPERVLEQGRQKSHEHNTSRALSTMANVQEAVKESLLGTTREPELSTQTRAAFDRNAKKDEATGEYYLTEVEFVDAVAPEGEDYVSGSIPGHLIKHAMEMEVC